MTVMNAEAVTYAAKKSPSNYCCDRQRPGPHSSKETMFGDFPMVLESW